MLVAKRTSTPRTAWFYVVIAVASISSGIALNLVTSSEVIDK